MRFPNPPETMFDIFHALWTDQQGHTQLEWSLAVVLILLSLWALAVDTPQDLSAKLMAGT